MKMLSILIMSNLSLPGSADAKAEKKSSKPSKLSTAIIVEAPKDEKNTVTVTVAKKDTVAEAKKKDSKKNESATEGKALDEAKEWYWDYDNNCWKECDPGAHKYSSDTYFDAPHHLSQMKSTSGST